MSLYINGIGSVSAQQLNTRSNALNLLSKQTNRLACVEPDYKDIIPAMQLRRMSKVVRIGIASAKQALQDAGIESPEMISLGTAYGCLADTETFLNKLLTQDEQMLTPTAFIQSTHNTVSGQIALLTQCTGHNFTYVHRGHSFETSLQEAMMWAEEKSNQQDYPMLIGGIDELTNDSFDIIARFGTYKKETESSESTSEGSIAGEGANLFVVSHQQNENSYAECIDVHLCNSNDIKLELKNFLQANQLNEGDIDTCFVGVNGDMRYDEKIMTNMGSLSKAQFLGFKKYCGEYPTSNAFAFALASVCLRNGNIPAELCLSAGSNKTKEPKHVLIYNHYKNAFHSFILLKKL